MSLSLFFFSALAASLLWTAACTAAAVHCPRRWLRRLVLALGLLAPLMSLLPWLAGTSVLAFVAKLEVNWFGAVLSLFLSALIGGGWVLKAGTQPRGGGWNTVPAAEWPIAGLFILFLLAKLSAAGVLLLLDQAALAKAGQLKVEAADLMMTNLPPALTDNQNAAPLYSAVFVLLNEDPLLGREDSPLAAAGTVNPVSRAVMDLLDRHAPTLALLREAAARPGCRFSRDWTRPSFAMLLPELQQLREAARLLQLATRRAAAEGRLVDAIRDLGLLARIGRHAAGEPLPISGLVGIAIDSLALDSLDEMLSRLTEADRPLLDDPQFRALVAQTPSLTRHFFGAEAFGLRTFASLADGSLGFETLRTMQSLDASPGSFTNPLATSPALMFYRIFLLPAEVAGYRTALQTQQQLSGQTGLAPTTEAAIASLESRLSESRPGILSSIILPLLSGAIRAEVRSRARHQAARVAVAATRIRLETGRLPEGLATLVPDELPASPVDPFTAGKPLRYRKADDVLLIYSVGPNGRDDGGPASPTASADQANDDIGMRLPIH